MAYEFLNGLFGKTEEGEDESLTLAQLKEKLTSSELKLVNLADGGYVSKEKFDDKVTELGGIRKQLDDANGQIKSFKEHEGDIEEIRSKAAQWEKKYNEDTKALNKKLETQEREHNIDKFFNGYKFTSVPAQKGIRDAFVSKEFKFEDGKFLGAEDYMKSLMEDDDYKGAFIIEQPPTPTPEPPAPEPSLPRFGGGTGGNPTPSPKDTFNFGFAGVRARK